MHPPIYDWAAARAAAESQVQHWTAVLRALDLAVQGHVLPAPSPRQPVVRTQVRPPARRTTTKPVLAGTKKSRNMSDLGALAVRVASEIAEPFSATDIEAQIAKRAGTAAAAMHPHFVSKLLSYRCKLGQLECVVKGKARRPGSYRRTKTWVSESGTCTDLASAKERSYAEFRATVPMPQPVDA